MSIVTLMENPNLTGLIVTLAAQSILISLLGITAMKLSAGRPAPFRALICTGTITVLGLAFVISIGSQLSHLSWYKSDLAGLWKRHTIDQTLTSDPITSPSFDQIPPAGQTRSQSAGEAGRFDDSVSIRSSQSDRLPVRAFLYINILGLMWMAGSLFLLIKLGYGLVLLKKFRSGLSSASEGKFDDLVKTVSGAFWKNRQPELYISNKVESPITIGLRNPVIIIPEKLYGTLSENELKSILLHELAHIYHYDHLVGMIKRVVLALHWWNPLVYRINLQHDLAREEVSDNYVLSELNPKEYSQCLADLAEKICLISNLPTTAGMAGRRFSLGKRVENILSKERSLAMRTSLNIRIMTFAFCAVLTLFIGGLHGKVETEEIDTTDGGIQSSEDSRSAILLWNDGSKISSEAAAELEEIVAQNPHDLENQALLMGYYYSRQLNDSAIRDKQEQAALWLIRNHPEAELLFMSSTFIRPTSQYYSEGERLWKELLLQYPADIRIIQNAGQYFTGSDPDFAVECFKLAQTLDPDNTAFWDFQMGHAYKSKMRKSSEEERQLLVEQTLNSYENSYAASEPRPRDDTLSDHDNMMIQLRGIINRDFLLPDLTRAALAAGELDKAAGYANQMLSAKHTIINGGKYIYYGNFTLGMLAVREGDLDAAETYLLQSVEKTGRGRPVTRPNMNLAKELLDRGRRDTVLAFLKKCLEHSPGKDTYSRWIQEIEEGKTPDFSAYLNF